MDRSAIINIALLFIMLSLAGWLSSQFGQLTGQEKIANIAKDYGTMALVALVFVALSHLSVGGISAVGIKNEAQLPQNLLIGAGVGFIITAQGKLLLSRLLQTPASIESSLGVLFVIILAPIVEEFFFRGTVFPFFERLLAGRYSPTISTITAAIIVSALAGGVYFAAWHLTASGGNESILIGEVIFSLIQIGLMKATGGDLAAPVASHFVRNLLTFGG